MLRFFLNTYAKVLWGVDSVIESSFCTVEVKGAVEGRVRVFGLVTVMRCAI